MVASSSNLLLVAASSRQGQVRRGSTKPNDHDLTSEIENRRGYMIGSTNTNNISGISGTNLMDNMIMLETVAPMASTTPPSATKSEEKPRPRPRPRRKKMASTGVDAMKKMIVTSSSVVVALPESPSRKQERAGEQRDDLESVFNNIRSASNRKVLAFDLSVPSMPDMLSMPAPLLPTPAMNQRSKLKNEMSNSNNDITNAPMKKKKNHMGRRLLQIKKRLTSKSKTSSSKQEEDEVCLSPGKSATTSTSSFGQTSQEEEDDLPFMDTMDMMMMNMTTTLKPRIRSMFHEEEEMMPMMMPVLPAPPCPVSTSTNDVVVAVTTTPSASFSSKLDKALSVLSPNDADDDGDDADEWGVFASYEDDDDEEEEDHHDDHQHNYHFKTKASHSRSSFTKHTINPCFQPRAHLPIFATAGAE